ncbi:ribulose bisphosphate carboxylase small subunit [Romeria aff. gracilis LEGE 07310]|uniref:Ribulose bisphosphate carboxylase small subunit n=1 Tax=Vasconcelosia minhoensis LEGE 07310 TaxID=915328 RepID=A0A8J7AXM3_9CYAN|nr:ribulose bisphosphate carboxylase small subunit [Romeria gracilis]MBE9079398.1 ribulose bisphosphate carboxylase small subunit [Romeria aff. gracilis LEGE 07310]
MSYYISPRFLNKLAVHITKNYLDLPQVRMPLILGIHGRKGEGKTFQCELVYERMGVLVVHISGGELESPDAGDPARLVRLRYREAAELVRVRGQMAVLMINDLDAGAGRFDRMTQYTVNTQLVNNTLMNIADNPHNVQLPGSYDETPLPRIPIVVTGNDFATLYAPLIREGRMQKFYWEPDHADRIGIVSGIFEPDGLSAREIEELVDRFSGQAIDFFGALRAQIYDEQITDFIHQVGIENVSRTVVNTKTPPQFKKPNFQLAHLLDVGQQMLSEQDLVRTMGLVREYNQAIDSGNGHQPPSVPQPPPDRGDEIRDATSKQHQQPSTQSSGREPQKTFLKKQTAVQSLSAEAREHIQSLLNQGYRVGLEHANSRRFRANAWQSSAIQAQDERAALAEVAARLADFRDDYVRLIGIDPQSRRRVLEAIIQRPA